MGRSWAKTDKSSNPEVFSRVLAFNHDPRAEESQISGMPSGNRDSAIAEQTRTNHNVDGRIES